MIELLFKELVRGIAAERGLTVSNVAGTIEFSSGKAEEISITFRVCDTWEVGIETNADNFDCDVRRELMSYFSVDNTMYEDIAMAHLHGIAFDECRNGVRLYCEFNKFDTELDTEMLDNGEIFYVFNNFNVNRYMEVYEKMREQMEEDDDIRRHTEWSLIQQFA